MERKHRRGKKIWKKKKEGEKEQNLMLQVVKYLGKTVQDRGLPERWKTLKGRLKRSNHAWAQTVHCQFLGLLGNVITSEAPN